MKLIFKLIGALVLLVVLGGAGAYAYVRTHDGPLGATPGGPFRTGELAATPNDWSFLQDRQLMEFQTMSPSTTREVWLAVYQGRLFVICAGVNEDRGLRNKRWPYYLENDERVILRIDDTLYEQRMQRIQQGPEVIPVLDIFGRKYRGGGVTEDTEISSGDSWMFEVLPR
jgi:hypothetical protein